MGQTWAQNWKTNPSPHRHLLQCVAQHAVAHGFMQGGVPCKGRHAVEAAEHI